MGKDGFIEKVVFGVVAINFLRAFWSKFGQVVQGRVLVFSKGYSGCRTVIDGIPKVGDKFGCLRKICLVGCW